MKTSLTRRMISFFCSAVFFVSLLPGIGMASPPNNPPDAVNDAFTVAEDSGATMLDVLFNDTCAPDAGETLTIADVGPAPAGCTVTLGVGAIAFTPDANVYGEFSFTYTVSDGNGGTDTATASVTVTPANDAPDAVDDSFTFQMDSGSYTLNVLANDSCAPDTGETLTIASISPVAVPPGASIFPAESAVNLTPAAGFSGTIKFSYTIIDSNGGTDTATATVKVNAPPVAADDSITVLEDSGLQMLDLIANDTSAPDTGETLTITAVTHPAHGITMLNWDVVYYAPAPDYYGTETFSYTVSDWNGGTDTATVTVDVTSVNDIPHVMNDSYTVQMNSGATALYVLANDTCAPDVGETLSIYGATAPENGSVTRSSNILYYTPNTGFYGQDSFEYSVLDSNGDFAGASVNITVNAPPAANNDSFAVDEDSGATVVNVLANDSCAPDTGETLTVTGVTQPTTGGSVTLLDGVVTFTPAADFIGVPSFDYTVSDGNGGSATATAIVVVRPVNDPPAAADDAFTVSEDSSATVLNVLANDTYAPDAGETLTVTAASASPAGCTVSLAGGVLSFTPDANVNGTFSFTYTVSDGNGGTDTATVTVTVSPVNDLPDAADDYFIVQLNSGATTLDVLANDTCAPDTGETLTITTLIPPTGCTVTYAPQSLGFTPWAGFAGIVTISYMISDGNGGTDAAVAAVKVNIPPDAVDDSITVAEDSGATALNVLANDSSAPDTGETLTVTNTSTTSTHGGTVTLNAGVVYYMPPENYYGTDALMYTISDGCGGHDYAVANITVSPVNDPPTAVNDTFAVAEDSGATALDVLANDSCAPDSGETLTVTGVTQPAAGGVVSLSGGIVSFAPAANYNGTATFTYTIGDGNGGTTAATVTVTVMPVNDNPDAVNDSFTVAEDCGATVLDVLANDTCSPDTGETLEIYLVGKNTSQCFADRSPDTKTLIFTPVANFNGTTIVTYGIRDGNGGVDFASVTVTVTPANDPPTAADDAFTVAEDSGIMAMDVLANDSCAPDSGETLTVTGVTQPAAGGVVSLSGGIVSFTPAANYNSTTAFTYTIGDGSGGTDTASVNVTVTPVNDPPTAVNDAYTIAEDCGTTTFDVLANDTCSPDTGETLTITAADHPTGICNAWISGGTVHITVGPNYHGTFAFPYTISDDNGGTASASITVTVTPVNDPPYAVDDTCTVLEDSGATVVNVLGNDSCAPDSGETLTVAAVTQPADGMVTLASGVVRYAPYANFNGTDTFEYTLSDGNGGTDTGTVTVTVTAVNDLPDAVDDAFTVAKNSGATVLNVLANDSCAPDTGETLAVTAVTQPSVGGTVALAGGVVSFTPTADGNGITFFTYTISDGNGGTDTANAVIKVNAPPTGKDDTLSVAEDSGVTVVDVLGNDSCAPDSGETLTVAGVTQPAHGTTSLDSGVVRYAPYANFNGTDTFDCIISDGYGGTATATVTVTVTPVNDLPALKAGIPAAAAAGIRVKGRYTLNLAAIFGDIDGDALTFTVAQNRKGPAAASADFAYTPASPGKTTLVFRANDGKADSADTYTVTLTVTDAEESSVLEADIATDQSAATLPVTVDGDSGDARVDLAGLTQSAQNSTGQMVVTFPALSQTDTFSVDIPASILSGLSQNGALTIQTGLGSITLPPEMLASLSEQCENSAEITIRQTDAGSLLKAVQDAVGSRTLFEIALNIDGSPVEWNNAQTPFTVSIPYTPTEEEKSDPSLIAVWYVDGSGASSRVDGVQYDAQTGCLRFATTHTGIFTVGKP